MGICCLKGWQEEQTAEGQGRIGWRDSEASYMIKSFCQRIAVSMFIDSRTWPNYPRKVLLKEHFYRNYKARKSDIKLDLTSALLWSEGWENICIVSDAITVSWRVQRHHSLSWLEVLQDAVLIFIYPYIFNIQQS